MKQTNKKILKHRFSLAFYNFFSKLAFEEKNRQCDEWHMTEVFKATIALISAHRHLHLQKERRTHAMSGQKCLD